MSSYHCLQVVTVAHPHVFFALYVLHDVVLWCAPTQCQERTVSSERSSLRPFIF